MLREVYLFPPLWIPLCKFPKTCRCGRDSSSVPDAGRTGSRSTASTMCAIMLLHNCWYEFTHVETSLENILTKEDLWRENSTWAYFSQKGIHHSHTQMVSSLVLLEEDIALCEDIGIIICIHTFFGTQSVSRISLYNEATTLASCNPCSGGA